MRGKKRKEKRMKGNEKMEDSKEQMRINLWLSCLSTEIDLHFTTDPEISVQTPVRILMFISEVGPS